ncbi:MAG: UDP-3-O-acyl-N-acetylglucosamine deacetylase [Nitrospinaceae bacterium]
MPKEHVLIVDDEKNIVSSLYGILEDEGYELTTAGDGMDALELVQSNPPDLVLLDIWLPGMDGIEVLKTIKTYHPEIEVLIMSGHGTIDTAVRATKLGAFDFIEKPFSLDQLTQAVDKALKVKRSRGEANLQGDNIRRPELPHCFQLMVEVKKAITTVAQHTRPVLITGEPGTGKAFIAQAIHHESKKARLPILKLDCNTKSATSMRAALFQPGRKSQRRAASAESAQDRVVYLSNIEALSLTLQDKLAQALEPAPANKGSRGTWGFLPARVYASTSRDLAELVEAGRFHEGLYTRLMETTIHVPALREYRAQIPTLVRKFFEERAEPGDPPGYPLTEDAMQALCAFDWPQNVKELRHVLEQISRKMHPQDTVTLEDLPLAVRPGRKHSGKGDGPIPEAPRQRTLKRSVVLCGRGLHSGIKTGLIMQPLPPNSGIIFGDISSGDTIPAQLGYVRSTDYSTCLKKGLFSVATIEHIMAVLHMYRITNLLIKIGDEAPVMDGSAKDFCQLLEDGEFEDQAEPFEEVVIDREYFFGDPEGAHIRIEPADRLIVNYHMDYPLPIGVMDFTFEYEGPDSFKREIAPARTFGFMQDVAQLTKMGFATGGKLDNFILLGDNKVLNTELRYPDEFARHKILDILGDFYLLGQPIRGRIHAHKSGHTQNVGLLKEIHSHLYG